MKYSIWDKRNMWIDVGSYLATQEREGGKEGESGSSREHGLEVE